jgi:hypothetical protein
MYCCLVSSSLSCQLIGEELREQVHHSGSSHVGEESLVKCNAIGQELQSIPTHIRVRCLLAEEGVVGNAR